MNYTSKHQLIGKTFVVKDGGYRTFGAGTEVFVETVDIDGDIVVRAPHDHHYVRSLDVFKQHFKEKESVWVAWNSVTYRNATTEEEAKQHAESLCEIYGEKTYIAESSNFVQKSNYVWAN